MPFIKKSQPKTGFSTKQKSYKRETEVAMQSAEKALLLDLKERINIYGFTKRYYKTSKSKHRGSGEYLPMKSKSRGEEKSRKPEDEDTNIKRNDTHALEDEESTLKEQVQKGTLSDKQTDSSMSSSSDSDDSDAADCKDHSGNQDRKGKTQKKLSSKSKGKSEQTKRMDFDSDIFTMEMELPCEGEQPHAWDKKKTDDRSEDKQHKAKKTKNSSSRTDRSMDEEIYDGKKEEDMDDEDNNNSDNVDICNASTVMPDYDDRSVQSRDLMPSLTVGSKKPLKLSFSHEKQENQKKQLLSPSRKDKSKSDKKETKEKTMKKEAKTVKSCETPMEKASPDTSHHKINLQEGGGRTDEACKGKETAVQSNVSPQKCHNTMEEGNEKVTSVERIKNEKKERCEGSGMPTDGGDKKKRDKENKKKRKHRNREDTEATETEPDQSRDVIEEDEDDARESEQAVKSKKVRLSEISDNLKDRKNTKKVKSNKCLKVLKYNNEKEKECFGSDKENIDPNTKGGTDGSQHEEKKSCKNGKQNDGEKNHKTGSNQKIKSKMSLKRSTYDDGNGVNCGNENLCGENALVDDSTLDQHVPDISLPGTDGCDDIGDDLIGGDNEKQDFDLILKGSSKGKQKQIKETLGGNLSDENDEEEELDLENRQEADISLMETNLDMGDSDDYSMDLDLGGVMTKQGLDVTLYNSSKGHYDAQESDSDSSGWY